MWKNPSIRNHPQIISMFMQAEAQVMVAMAGHMTSQYARVARSELVRSYARWSPTSPQSYAMNEAIRIQPSGLKRTAWCGSKRGHIRCSGKMGLPPFIAGWLNLSWKIIPTINGWTNNCTNLPARWKVEQHQLPSSKKRWKSGQTMDFPFLVAKSSGSLKPARRPKAKPGTPGEHQTATLRSTFHQFAMTNTWPTVVRWIKPTQKWWFSIVM